nr:centrosomal protein of 41 kDa [Hymenolepis microstoma]
MVLEDYKISHLDDSNHGKQHDCVSDHANPETHRRHTLESVIHGIGECDINDIDQSTKDSKTVKTEHNNCPYLLLDVRDKDEFDSCHIIKAINYPYTMLSRCMNFEIREMLAYKNKPGHIIICYDEDETLSPLVATVLVERGYENVFLLSGGLKVAWKLFPKGLILGDAPPTLKKVTSAKKRTRNSNSTSRLPSAAASCTSSFRASVCDDGASSVYASSIGGRSVTSSVRRAIRYTYDTYESVGARGTPNGGEEFSMMDLTHLDLTLNSLFAAG